MNENINQTLRELLTRVMLFRLKQNQSEDADILERYRCESVELIELMNDERIYRGIYPYILDWSINELQKYQNFLGGYLSNPGEAVEIQQSISQIIQRLTETNRSLRKSKTFETIDRIASNFVIGEYFHLFDLANALCKLTGDTIQKLSLSADTSVDALLQSEIPRQAKIGILIDLSEKLFKTMSPEISQYQPLFIDLLERYKQVNIALISGVESVIKPISVEVNFERSPRHAYDKNIDVFPKDASSVSFEESIEHARRAAYEFLTSQEEDIPCKDFYVSVTLNSDITHTDHSSEVPIALAIIGQRFDWKMNPHIVAVGKFRDRNATEMDFVDEKGKQSLVIKLKAIQKTDGLENLLTPFYIRGRRYRNIQTTIKNLNQAVIEYFGEQQWNDAQEKRKQVRRLRVPHNRYVHRQQDVNRCASMSKSHPILMITGLRGIGKSVLLDGFMRRVYRHYDGISRIDIRQPKNIDTISFDRPYQEIARFLEKHGDTRLVKSQMMMSSEEKAEVVLENLQQKRLMLIFDDFNYLLNRNRQIADADCLTLVDELIKNQTQLRDSRVVFVSNTDVFELKSAQVETYKLGGFSYEEMMDYLRRLKGELPDEQILEPVFKATGGHPWVLTAIHNLVEIGYSYEDILEHKEEYLLGGEEETEKFLIGGEDDFWSVKNLLDPILEKIGEGAKSALYRFSVYREPVSREGWVKLMNPKIYQKLSRYFLVEGANDSFWEHAIVRDYAHLLLAENPEEYKRCHSIAASYYEKQDKKYGDYRLIEEAIYHYNEANNPQGKELQQTFGLRSIGNAAFSFFREHNYVKATEQFQIMIDELGEDNCYREVFSDFAFSLEQIGEIDDSVIESWYRKGIKRGSTRAKARLACFLFEKDRIPEAASLAQEACAEDSDWGKTYEHLGSYLVGQNNLADAERILKKGIQNVPKWDGCYVRLTLLYRRQERYDEAETLIQQGFEVYPRSVRLLEEYCLLLYEQNLDIKEHELFLKRAEVCKNLGEPKIIESLDEQHHEQLATDLLKVLAKLGSAYGMVYVTLARRLDDKDEAIKVLRQGMKYAQTDGQVYIALAQRLTDDEKEAIKVLRQGMEKAPTDGGIYLALAQRLTDDEAIKVLRQGMEKAPTFGAIYRALAQRLTDEEAIKVLRQGMEKAPTDGGIYLALAQRLTDDEEAIEVLRQGMGKVPTDGGIYLALARRLEDDAEIINVLRKGIENSIRSPRLYLMLSERLEALQTTDAREEITLILQRGVDLNIPDSRLYIQLARRVRESEPDESSKILEQGIQAIHKFGRPRFRLIAAPAIEIESLLSDGNVAELDTDLEEELQSEQEFHVDFQTEAEDATSLLKTQIKKLFEDGDLKTLMRLLEQQLYLPNNFHLALLHWEIGNREAAGEYLKMALEEDGSENK